MRRNPYFELDDRETIERLIRENPWATLVSKASKGLVVSSVMAELAGDGPYASEDLAREMRLAREEG